MFAPEGPKSIPLITNANIVGRWISEQTQEPTKDKSKIKMMSLMKWRSSCGTVASFAFDKTNWLFWESTRILISFSSPGSVNEVLLGLESSSGSSSFFNLTTASMDAPLAFRVFSNVFSSNSSSSLSAANETSSKIPPIIFSMRVLLLWTPACLLAVI